jgi:hypothetical protein
VRPGDADRQLEIVAVLPVVKATVVERVEDELAGEPQEIEGARRSSARKLPVAAKFLRAMMSSASLLRYSSDLCLAASRSNAVARSRCCSAGSPVWRSSLPEG